MHELKRRDFLVTLGAVGAAPLVLHRPAAGSPGPPDAPMSVLVEQLRVGGRDITPRCTRIETVIEKVAPDGFEITGQRLELTGIAMPGDHGWRDATGMCDPAKCGFGDPVDVEIVTREFGRIAGRPVVQDFDQRFEIRDITSPGDQWVQVEQTGICYWKATYSLDAPLRTADGREVVALAATPDDGRVTLRTTLSSASPQRRRPDYVARVTRR